MPPSNSTQYQPAQDGGKHRGGRRPGWLVPAAALVVAAVVLVTLLARSGTANSSASHPVAGQLSNSPTAGSPTTAGGDPSASGSPRASTAAGSGTPVPASWKLVFNSDFSGSTLNSAIWGTCYPWASGGCTNYGNSGEKEWYQASQDQVSGGVLHLVAQRMPTAGYDRAGHPKQYACRSGMVTTAPGFHFQYGYVQVTARVPYGQGLWPAFWLAAANGQWPPEIDILEHWGTSQQSKIYLHALNAPRQGGPFPAPDINVGWHTFAVSWTPTRLTWIVDGRQVMTTAVGVPQQPMYFVANMAVYDATAGGCSGSVDIQSVKIWQP